MTVTQKVLLQGCGVAQTMFLLKKLCHVMGVIYVPICTSSFDFSMRRTVDQGGEGVFTVIEQFFGRLLVLTYSSSERRICITGFVDKMTETDMKGFPKSP